MDPGIAHLQRQVAHLRICRIPELNFNDTRLEDVVVFLNDALKTCNMTTPPVRVSCEPELLDETVTLSMSNTSAHDVLIALCNLLEIEMLFQRDTCVLREKP